MNKSNRKLLPIMATAVVLLLLMCGIGSASYITATKQTDPIGAKYMVGETITYNITVQVPFNAPQGYWFTVDVYDRYPDGYVELVESGLTLYQNGGPNIKYYTRTYVVAEPDIVNDKVTNEINATGIDSFGDPARAWVVCTSTILRYPEADFDFDAGDCDLTVQFTPNATDPDGTIDLYEWDFENDGTTDKTTTNANVFSQTFLASGDYDVKLTVTDNDSLTDSIVKTVHITAPPTISSLTASPASVTVPPGGWVTVTGTVSDPDGDNLDYTWTIVNATGTHVITGGPIVGPYPKDISTPCFVDKVPTDVTLTVTDPVNCVDSKDIRLGTPPHYVPLLTLPGLLALIGMMCIVGAGRIITRGRRS